MRDHQKIASLEETPLFCKPKCKAWLSRKNAASVRSGFSFFAITAVKTNMASKIFPSADVKDTRNRQPDILCQKCNSLRKVFHIHDRPF
mmetsp:Transcript_65910/g.117162  ORF Transcript_65910/g.117162 Transcript_65910/m.117162 type:complete len:89 (+) Transcript_65910:18-284(+)